MMMFIDAIIIGVFVFICWLMTRAYSLWLMMPDIIQYILLLPISLFLTVLGSFGLPFILYREEILSGNMDSFWMTNIAPIIGVVIFVSLFSFLIAFLSPRHEKTILRGLLGFFVFITVGVWIARITTAVLYEDILLWDSFTILDVIWSLVFTASSVVYWVNADFIVAQKAK
ncbi:MAG: hypothetical protein JKY11_07525 [Alphaproteobacteria bacterium]|nr:hypothetical protein [Alphaproteobacteria bacterium]